MSRMVLPIPESKASNSARVCGGSCVSISASHMRARGGLDMPRSRDSKRQGRGVEAGNMTSRRREEMSGVPALQPSSASVANVDGFDVFDTFDDKPLSPFQAALRRLMRDRRALVKL